MSQPTETPIHNFKTQLLPRVLAIYVSQGSRNWGLAHPIFLQNDVTVCLKNMTLSEVISPITLICKAVLLLLNNLFSDVPNLIIDLGQEKAYCLPNLHNKRLRKDWYSSERVCKYPT